MFLAAPLRKQVVGWLGQAKMSNQLADGSTFQLIQIVKEKLVFPSGSE